MKKLLFCVLTLSQIAHINAFTTFFNHDSAKTFLGLACVFAGSIGITQNINNHPKTCTLLKSAEKHFSILKQNTSHSNEEKKEIEKHIPKVPPLTKQQLINKNVLITSALIYTSGLWLLYAGQK